MVLAREINVEDSSSSEASGSYASVHSQLVAYVLALSGRGSGAGGGGVWREHSYARASKHASRREPRTLLAPPDDTYDPDAPIDVGKEGEIVVDTLPPLPFDNVPEEDEEPLCSEEVEEEWESRVAALAPTAAHARLAQRAADILRDLRLARLASDKRHRRREQARAAAYNGWLIREYTGWVACGGFGPVGCAQRAADILRDLRLARLATDKRHRRREQARAAAYKLRRALAPTWSWSASGAGGGGGAAWLYSVLSAYLPRRMRALLEELLEELRRMAPRLASRLPAVGGRLPPDPLCPAPPPCVTPHGPMVVWVSAGRVAADARWERRLRGLIPTRVVGGGPLPPRAPPDQWCAAQAANARAGLDDVLAEAGSRPVFLAGFDAGAALCCALYLGLAGAAGGAVRGLALLAPPLLTAEGEETLEPRAPILLIAGETGGDRIQVLEACLGSGAGSGGARRLVLVGGADHALRLRAGRGGAPQPALDAAVLEEVVRWAHELADAEDDDDSASNNEFSGDVIDVEDDDEYAHLPSPWAPPAAAPPATPAPTPAPPSLPALGTPPGVGTRAIEIVEGRVVSRVSGSTPLLLTPRRAAPPAPRAAPATTPAPAPAPADIMQMPIVFADDDPAPVKAPIQAPTSAEPTESPVTVTSGSGRGGRPLKYTRVIVAKRGARGGAVPPRLPAPLPPHAPAHPANPRPRHLLLRRAVQVVNRGRRPHKEH